MHASPRIRLGPTIALTLLSACRTPLSDVPDPGAPAAEAEAPPAQASSTEPADEDNAAPAPTTSPECEALPGWRFERIELPPPFAPTIPAGTEVLWFAPGMFEPPADDYFTYAFSLDMEGGPLDASATEQLLVQYYRGLMAAVAEGRDATPEREAAVTMAEHGLAATIELTDEFTGGGALTLHLRMSTPEGSDCLRVLATAKPSEDNWARLAQSVSCLCDGAPP